ncbi:hypothetical protein B0H14DRAFT_3437735 [Mycena olivaceomarginata]|nr:hypothetical protein B0H14DRAFT_3437735 [Mycena olivaceomarginata]
MCIATRPRTRRSFLPCPPQPHTSLARLEAQRAPFLLGSVPTSTSAWRTSPPPTPYLYAATLLVDSSIPLCPPDVPVPFSSPASLASARTGNTHPGTLEGSAGQDESGSQASSLPLPSPMVDRRSRANRQIHARRLNGT